MRLEEKKMFTEKELTFSTFIFYSLSDSWNTSPAEVYKVLNSSGILDGYIIEGYDVLHTLGKEYLVEDITEFVKDRGFYIESKILECVDKVQKIYKRELENKIICNIASVKKCELRKAMDIYYSSNVPEKIEKEMGDVKKLDVQALTKEIVKRKRKFLR